MTAWVFYGLSAHPKPQQFERLVQALIFTFIVHALTVPCRWFLITIGDAWKAIGPWDQQADSLCALIVALGMGLGLAFASENDMVHGLLRRFKFTSRTSHPSEWFYVLSKKPTFVVLQLIDGRRLYGWPKEWPLGPAEGQFYIMLPTWLEGGAGSTLQEEELSELDGILIAAKEVRWIEFLAASLEADLEQAPVDNDTAAA